MRSTLDTIRTRYGHELPAASRREFEVLQAWLDLRTERLRTAIKAEAALEKACEAFAASKSRIQSWSLDDVDLTVVTAGLRKIYKRGRKGMDAVAIRPAPECFHEWRKRAKYHRYHLHLLRRAWPPVLSAAGKAARDLSDWLGDDHDVAVFRQVLGEHADEVGSPSQYPALLTLLSRRAEELQSASFSLGRRVYAETSKAHAERIQAILAAWHSEALAT
jgi:CHAD domain-containing protein